MALASIRPVAYCCKHFRQIRPLHIGAICILSILLILCNQGLVSHSDTEYKTRALQQNDKYSEFYSIMRDAPKQHGTESLTTLTRVNTSIGHSWAETQLRRQQHISHICELASHETDWSLNDALKHSKLFRDSAVVDRRHNTLYCAIPKAACSSWRSALAVLTGKVRGNDSRTLRYVHDVGFMSSIGIYPLAVFKQEKQKNLILDHFHKMIVVRHPFERLVSAFRDKFETYNRWTKHFQMTYGRNIIQRYRKSPSQESISTGYDVTFPEFVHWLLDKDVDPVFKFNPHWASYQDLCQPCLINYNHIIDFNTFQIDTENVLKTVFNVDNAGEFFPYRNAKTVKSRNIESEYLQLLSNGTLSNLYDLYATDFIMFNYTWPR